MGVIQDDGGSQQVLVLHHNYGIDSSVTATVGSGPLSVTLKNMKSCHQFQDLSQWWIWDGSVVSKALVLGNFESAVSLCLLSDRFADAIFLAIKGGPERLQHTHSIALFAYNTPASIPEQSQLHWIPACMAEAKCVSVWMARLLKMQINSLRRPKADGSETGSWEGGCHHITICVYGWVVVLLTPQ